MALHWTDTEAVADALLDAHPDVLPADLTEPQAVALITGLDGFADSVDPPDSEALDAILFIWNARLG